MLSLRINRMLPAISVLTHVSSDAAQPSLMLHARDGQRYIFGRLAEGFQRSLGERQIKSARVSDLFLSGQLTWDSVAGLPGYLLTMAEYKKGLTLHTSLPDRGRAMVQSWRHFLVHNPLVGTIGEPSFQDSNIAVEAVLVDGDADASEKEVALSSTCYIIQILPVRGRFLVEKAVALGVPKGPMFGQLTSGREVTLASGRTVRPEDVVEPSLTPSRALLLDLPSEAHVRSALAVQWERNLKRKNPRDVPYAVETRVVYHFLGPSVNVEGASFAKLIASFGPGVQHFISHRDYTPDSITLKGLAKLQKLLSQTLPDNFAPLVASPAARELPPTLAGVRIVEQDELAPLGPSDAVPRTLQKQFPRISKGLSGHMADEEILSTGGLPSLRLASTLSEPEIITLGTGSSLPSKYRNMSGTILRVPTAAGIQSTVFDAGEGTLNTLARLIGPESIDAWMRELKILYISHMHADHHIGAQRIITRWLSANPAGTLTLIAPNKFDFFMQEWRVLDDIELERISFVDLESIILGNGYETRVPPTTEERASIAEMAGAVQVGACRAYHADRSYSGFIEWALASGDRFRAAYSGDTRPSKYFSHIAEGADLLIHEATHEDALLEDAKLKRHSTIGEALQVGEAMGARAILLTHFSQRYPQLPNVDLNAFSAPTALAFDGLHARISQFPELQNALPKLAAVFSELHDDEMAEDALAELDSAGTQAQTQA